MKLVYDLDIETILEIDQNIMELFSIKLFLQPIVKNAIIHGIKPAQSGFILISGRECDDCIEFTISDNGVGTPGDVVENLRLMLKKGYNGKGYGIANVINRINLPPAFTMKFP